MFTRLSIWNHWNFCFQKKIQESFLYVDVVMISLWLYLTRVLMTFYFFFLQYFQSGVETFTKRKIKVYTLTILIEIVLFVKYEWIVSTTKSSNSIRWCLSFSKSYVRIEEWSPFYPAQSAWTNIIYVYMTISVPRIFVIVWIVCEFDSNKKRWRIMKLISKVHVFLHWEVGY